MAASFTTDDSSGLPDLPKSLSGLLNANSATWRKTGRIHAHKTNIHHNLSESSNGASRGGQRPKKKRVAIPPGNLDAALALLRNEMVSMVMRLEC